MHCMSLATFLAAQSRFHSPAVCTHWPFSVDVPLKKQLINWNIFAQFSQWDDVRKHCIVHFNRLTWPYLWAMFSVLLFSHLYLSPAVFTRIQHFLTAIKMFRSRPSFKVWCMPSVNVRLPHPYAQHTIQKISWKTICVCWYVFRKFPTWRRPGHRNREKQGRKVGFILLYTHDM